MDKKGTKIKPKMNGYERIKAALAGEATDKTPLMLHNFMMAAQEAGVDMATYRDNPKEIANVFLNITISLYNINESTMLLLSLL